MAVCREGRTMYPEDAELLTQEAWLCYLAGDFPATEARLLRLLQGPGHPGNYSHLAEDPGLWSYLTRHNLAVLYRHQHLYAEAEKQWRLVLQERPDMADARLGLGELYLSQQRWQDMETVLTELQANPQTKVQAAVLLGQKHIVFKEYAEAKRLQEEAIALQPAAPGPRIVLARALMGEGKDRAAAEQALRDVLTLDPNNHEARQNLAYLQQLPR
jgi:tetratricopeptide (TPR) repeat protein